MGGGGVTGHVCRLFCELAGGKWVGCGGQQQGACASWLFALAGKKWVVVAGEHRVPVQADCSG